MHPTSAATSRSQSSIGPRSRHGAKREARHRAKLLTARAVLRVRSCHKRWFEEQLRLFALLPSDVGLRVIPRPGKPCFLPERDDGIGVGVLELSDLHHVVHHRCIDVIPGPSAVPQADRLVDGVNEEWRPEFIPPIDSHARDRVAGWRVMGNAVLHHDHRHAVTGLVVVAAWALLFCVVQAQYVPLETSYQAHLDTLNNPPILQDPPVQVARAEFFVGTVLVLAVPAATFALLNGLSTARNSRGVTWVRVLGWTTFGIGAVGALPALLAGFFGAVGAFFDALTLLG